MDDELEIDAAPLDDEADGEGRGEVDEAQSGGTEKPATGDDDGPGSALGLSTD